LPTPFFFKQTSLPPLRGTRCYAIAHIYRFTLEPTPRAVPYVLKMEQDLGGNTPFNELLRFQLYKTLLDNDFNLTPLEIQTPLEQLRNKIFGHTYLSIEIFIDPTKCTPQNIKNFLELLETPKIKTMIDYPFHCQEFSKQLSTLAFATKNFIRLLERLLKDINPRGNITQENAQLFKYALKLENILKDFTESSKQRPMEANRALRKATGTSQLPKLDQASTKKKHLLPSIKY
jgi:hypothetical protein